MKTTKQDKGARALIAAGHKEVKIKKNEHQGYRKFQVSYRPEYFFFLNKKGTLRTGKNINSSNSIGQIK